MYRFQRRWMRGEILPAMIAMMIAMMIACIFCALDTAASDKSASSNLSDIETLSQNPEQLRKSLQAAIAKAKEDQERIEQRLQSLHEKIDLLHQSLPVIQSLRNQTFDTPSPSDPKNTAFTGSALIPMPLDQQHRFFTRFEQEIYPLLSSGGGNCYSCHAAENKSELRFLEDQEQTFQRLIMQQYFDPSNPMSFITRVESKLDKVVMPPPPMKPWEQEKIDILRRFSEDLTAVLGEMETPYDERFPMELMEEYTAASQPESSKPDTTFLTYYQLRNKIQTLFSDDWTRGETDYFQKYIALFAGADFYTRFNESDEPTAQYLTGLDLLGADVASKAYLNRSGPFQSFSQPGVAALKLNQPDEDHRRAIHHIYEKMLYRKATEAEMRQSFALIRSVQEKHQPWRDGDYRLDFEVEVEGDAGVKTVRNISIDVTNSPHSLYQTQINQNTDHDDAFAEHTLPQPFTFHANDSRQMVEVSNSGTRALVSFAGIEIRGPLPGEQTRLIGADDPQAALHGPWDIDTQDGVLVLLDDNEHKGECSVQIPVAVDETGQYEITVKWYQPSRKKKKTPLARKALINIFSHDTTRLLKNELPPKPPQGEAHFKIDQTVDTIAFWDLNTAFQFAQEDFVEINNKGTAKRVTADAVTFDPINGGESILVDDHDAEGVENWHTFTEYAFRPYNTTGDRTVNDRIENKGELWIRYKPSIDEKRWDENTFYKVGVGFPGQARNETHVPVIVKAKTSSPIVRYVYPEKAPMNARVEIDASASYDTQHSDLHFTWRQIGGPAVQIDDPHAPAISFDVKHRRSEQASWEALVRALIRHPDFMFTRPFSLDQLTEAQVKERLLLVKIAQDLTGRPPLRDEIEQLNQGKSIADMIDGYINSLAFEDFYFHRIRLYLESQGKADEDEPVRIWCYIVFNDRPFKEILTADYTVDEQWNRKPRPSYYGKTGILTTQGFIKGKPGLPHFNYAAQVVEKFLGYVFEVPAEIVDQRDGVTAASTTSPDGACYSCHKILTPLAFQRLHWADNGKYRSHDQKGLPLDDSDRGLVPWYPFKGEGMEAFTRTAQHKERFIRTLIDTHFLFFTGREMRYETDERDLYKRLWDNVHKHNFSVKQLIKAVLLSPEYQGENHDEPAEATISQTNH